MHVDVALYVPAHVPLNVPPHVLLNVPAHVPLDVPAHVPDSSTHLRAHETQAKLVCRLLLEKKKKENKRRKEYFENGSYDVNPTADDETKGCLLYVYQSP